MSHSQFLSLGAIGEPSHRVGEVPPIRACCQGDVTHACCHQGAHLLADVVTQQGLQLLAPDLLAEQEQII
jgi:hypothetical protein